jgi:hypothetical protein
MSPAQSMSPAMRFALIALMMASNMDVRLYAWSFVPVRLGRLGTKSENKDKGMLVVKQRREEIDVC